MKSLITFLGADAKILRLCSVREQRNFKLIGLMVCVSLLGIGFLTWNATQYLFSPGLVSNIFRTLASVFFTAIIFLWYRFLFVTWRFDPRFVPGPQRWMSTEHLPTYLILSLGLLIYSGVIVIFAELYAFERFVDDYITTLQSQQHSEDLRAVAELGLGLTGKAVMRSTIVTRMQLTSYLLGPYRFLIHLVFACIVFIPAVLIGFLKIMTRHTYHYHLHAQERLMIESAYIDACEEISALLNRVTETDIPMYSRYDDPPFNTKPKSVSW